MATPDEQSTGSFWGVPEMRIAWISLPFLAGVFIVNLIALGPSPLSFISLGLVLAVAVIIVFYAASLARSNREVKIERSELKSIIFDLEDALILYDENFKMLFFNPAAERLFGIPSGKIVGRTLSPGDAQDPERHLLTQVIFPSLAPVMTSRTEPGSYPQVVDISFETPNLELRVKTNAIADPSGKVLGFVKTIRDRTRDVAAIRSKNEFITVASHQLRTPITGIAWALETLEKDASIGEADRAIVGNALEASHQLANIVEDLLMASKIEDGRFGYKFEPIDLVDFINKVLGEIMPHARSLGLAVYFDHPKETKFPPAYADPEKLTMLLQNLLDNAVRYNVKGGSITVKIEAPDGPFLTVSVQDTGIGIPPEGLEKIFTKFYRAENALKSQTEGSGLGLYIAQNIVRAHGGKIWADSQAGRGTVFSFTLATDRKFVPGKEVPLEW
ncbi:MAG: hypothetical protein A2122_02465 [Candidatus Liptonbacteria bacterium GWB1_49_6]|uniref:histidine kinase n=1 Tax=Candidatus Liptonbacteria bacterium GWB1_49_6 TaxID=1798644 RepID=A0A1G2C700_9BACT|nr:MAG: hypothetical protein A2122_02465 [Candidatus Liptonbacteria bacterium GWB1_49_6]